LSESVSPTDAIADLSAPPGRPRDVLIRRAAPPEVLVPLVTLPFGVILLVMAGAFAARIGGGFGAAEGLGLAAALTLGPMALWLAGMQLWGRERVWIAGDSLCRRRSVGPLGFTRRVPIRSVEAWNVDRVPPGLPGEQGFVLEARLARPARPLAIGLGMRLERGHLEWLASHLEGGVRLARDDRDRP